MARKLPGRAIQAGTITVTQLETTVATTVQTGGGPKITAVQVTSNSYVVLDDTAVDIAGGYIKITGTGFAAGCQVLINNTPATSTTYIGPTEVRAQLPATAAGTYMLYLINADGGVAIRVNGVTFSATPSWVTASDLTSYALGDAISIQLAATGASTFALAAGSTLPTGLALSAGGLLSGSVTGLENDTSYSFTITAIDAENQDSPRTFSITITVQLQVSRSLRFNSADSAYLSGTPAVAGNRRIWTFSIWTKLSGSFDDSFLFAGSVSAPPYVLAGITGSGALFIDYFSSVGVIGWRKVSTSLYRDFSAWYHFLFAIDTTQGTPDDRIKLYVNGSQITSFSSSTNPSLNVEATINNTVIHNIGRYITGGYMDGYMAEVYFIDGQQLTPAAFAETNNSTGQYIPKKYTGTYGTNGFYLPFTDNSSVVNLGRNYQPLTADPFWNRTVLLLNGTGTNNANNNTFTDSSTNAFAITRNGNTTQGTFSPFSQTGWGNYFDGTGDYLSVADNAAFTLGSGDFTVEVWVYKTTTGTQRFISAQAGSSGANTSASYTLQVNASEKVVGSVNSGATNYAATSSGDCPLNAWTHIVLARDGNTLRLYINGVQDGTASVTGVTVNDSSDILGIGSLGAYTSLYWPGYLSNFRLVKGTCVYPNGTTFTPPTTPLTAISGTSLLTCQSNRFIDNSTNIFTITRNGDTRVVAFSPFTPTTAYSAATNGGSAYFDGSGDYLTVADNTALEVPTQDFTIEAWVYLTSLPSSGAGYTVIQKGRTGTSDFEYSFEIENNAGNMRLLCRTSSNGTSLTTANGNTISLAANTWYHVAVTRTTTTASFWFEGVAAGSGTVNSTTYTGAATVGLFANNAGSSPLVGYASNFRLVKGVAVYTGAFTPPTAPVTAITNTSLLLNFTNAGIQDATGKNLLETVGDAKISTAQSKWAGSSMLFDGTGDYLSVPYSPNLNMGTGNFTCEFWVYVPSNPSVSYPSIIGPQDTAPYGIGIRYGNTGYANKFTVHLYAVSSWVGDPILASSSTYSLSQWHHVALTRSGTTLTLWVNGVSAASTTSSNQIDFASNNKAVWIGASFDGANSYFNGYIQDLRITRAARYTGTFTPPTAQFAYNQGDINYNQWVPTNFSVTAGTGNDSVVDSPTNWGVDTGLGGEVRGNYCTLNPNIPPKNSGTASRTLANGNLDLAGVSGGWTVAGGTFRIFAGSGRWYFETTGGAASSTVVGFHKLTRGYFLDAILGYTDGADTEGYAYGMDGNKLNNGVSAYGASWTTSDVIGCAIDASGATATITFYKNGVSQGVAFSNLTGDFIPAVSIGGTGPVVCNFGQRPFAYAAPAGFKCMNTHNLPALAVAKSNTAFDALAYTGDGAASKSITGLPFQPDLVWIKSRSNASGFHIISDSVRGAGNWLTSNATNVEAGPGQLITAFNADGFSLNLTPNNTVNESGGTYVAWAWDAGTTTVVNTAGTIQSNVRVNAAAGISIVSYTGTQATATVGHGLGTAPKLIIAKSRSVSNTNWVVYHSSLGSTSSLLILNLTNATTTITNYWGSAVPTSTVFGVANGVYDNNNGSMIAYCFAEVPGFSAFGTYTGNGSADGPFVYTGFRPRYILLKSSTVAATNWQINDTARDTYNVANKRLAASATDAEATNFNFGDIVSNGFKIRQTDQTWNSSGQTYIYAAFAESPFKYARAR